MEDRRRFLQRLSEGAPSRLRQAVALLWYYEQTQQYTERSAADLARDIQDDGFGSQNITRLRQRLAGSRDTVRGSRRDTFRVNAAHFPNLTQELGPLINATPIQATSSVIPSEFVAGTRTYLERMVNQINGSYDSGFYDSSAVILRRMMESLIIEVYLRNERTSEIKNDNVFFALGELTSTLIADQQIETSRGLKKGLNLIKDIGDTAAHHRTYITPKQDIDENKTKIRRTIHELLVLAGVAT